jgi:hypothetical protein
MLFDEFLEEKVDLRDVTSSDRCHRLSEVN